MKPPTPDAPLSLAVSIPFERHLLTPGGAEGERAKKEKKKKKKKKKAYV